MRRDIRERGVLAWLAATMSAGLAGLLLRGPVSTALADWGAAAHICARLGWVCCLLAAVLLAGGAVSWAVAHRLQRGLKYALRHWQLSRSIARALLEAGYETVYIGSRRGKTNGFLRIYDKKQEQIQTMGYRYDEALQHESWVRFEASFLHDAAHQLTEQLLSEGMTAQDLQRWIARHITDKYRFVRPETGEATEFTADLMGVAAGSSVAALSTPSPRDNSLRQSIRYLRNGSGLYSTLFKVANIWGPEAARELMDFLLCEYEQYQDALLDGEYPYKLRELTAWLQRHAAETAKHPLTSYL